MTVIPFRKPKLRITYSQFSSYNAIPHPAIVVDNHGVISQVNRAAEKISGKSVQQLVHKPVHSFFHPAKVTSEKCGLCRAIKQGVSMSAQILEFPEKDRWYLVSLAPIKVGDKSSGMVQSLTDITEGFRSEEAFRKSESQLRTLIESLPDLVLLKDPDGVFLACNTKFERLFGAKESEIIGKTDYDFVDRKLADFFREKDKAAMISGKPITNEEEVIYAEDGHRELLETIKTPIFEPDGKLIGVLGVGRDITSRRQTEESLRRTQKMDAIGQLTGGISHDFNNLLGIILGNIELLEMQMKDDDEAHERVESIKKASQRAANLTKQLLSFSHL